MAENNTRRRKVLQATGTVAGVGLAGCSFLGGGDGGDTADQDLGERVPALTFIYWPNAPYAPYYEASAPLIQSQLQERLGININLETQELSQSLSEHIRDERPFHVNITSHHSVPPRLSRVYPLDRIWMDDAGNRGGFNMHNYSTCDISNASSEAIFDLTPENVSEAFRLRSEASLTVPFGREITFGAYRSDSVEAESLGQTGVGITNPNLFIDSVSTDGEPLSTDVSNVVINSSNHILIGDSNAVTPWNQLIHSPLAQFNHEWEQENVLADSVEREEAGDELTKFTFTLKDDITFHNGDPITPEDVKFSYDFLEDTKDLSPVRNSPEIESSQVVDGSTVEFVVHPPAEYFFTQLTSTWGVLHQGTWEAATDNPEEFTIDPNNYDVGSGPFQIENVQRGSSMTLSPHDGHPRTPEQGLNLVAYQSGQAAQQAFTAGELDFATGLAPGTYNRFSDQENISTTVGEGFLPIHLWINVPEAPMKFREFRRAMGIALNRREINETAFFGEAGEPTDAAWVRKPHPIRRDVEGVEEAIYNYTDDPTGDTEAARQLLRDNGWGWDSNDNLHYPPDADLEPLWPAGEAPDPANYDCLNEDGEYTGRKP